MPLKKDIENRDDLLLLIQEFYKKLLADNSISYLFTDVAKIDLDHHLPVLVDFWDSLLFQSGTYQKNAMQPHIALHQKSPLTKHHFTTWLGYFKETVDECFAGDNAFIIKERATSIATVMQIKTHQLSYVPPFYPEFFSRVIYFPYLFTTKTNYYETFDFNNLRSYDVVICLQRQKENR